MLNRQFVNPFLIMKLPSIMKTPKYQKFHITPRYYDPIKEDMDQRRENIKRELAAQGKLADDNVLDAPLSNHSHHLRGAFSSRKPSSTRSTSLLQLGLITFLTILCFGYLHYGNNIFYSLLMFIPLYIILRWKKAL